jgi:hypothetical protein
VRVSFVATNDLLNQPTKIGGMEVVLAVDPLKVPIKDINVVAPTINFGSAGFGTTNRDHLRMFHWKPENADTQIRIVMACPNGVEAKYMFFDVVYPRGKVNPVTLTNAAVKAYDLQGMNVTSRVTTTLKEY